MTTTDQTKLEIVKKIIESRSITICDADDEPFLYSSGNRGPGYTMIKGLCGQPGILKFLINQLAIKVNSEIGMNIDFIDGNVTGGMIPGWELRNQLSVLQDREIPYVYLRDARKQGGHNELITGHLDNPLIEQNMRVLVVEELVNFGETTMNAVETFRNCGYECNYAACILSYDQPDAIKQMEKMGIKLMTLITLGEVLDIAEEHNLLNKTKVQNYKSFLKDSIRWQLDHGLAIPEQSAKEAIKRGYRMVKLSTDDALKFGAPENKLDSGVVYWKQMEPEKPETMIFVALDYDNHKDILNKAKELAAVSGPYGFKLNLDSAISFDMSGNTITRLIQKLQTYQRPIFVDLKMWNGVRTMSAIIKNCVNLGISIVNVYAHVGKKYMRELVEITRGTKTKLFINTVLTHYTDEDCLELYKMSMRDTVRMFAKWAFEVQADGVILPATCLDCVSDINLIKLCPGIRYGDEKSNNQEQSRTPLDAVKMGANYLVIGTLITEAPKSKEMLELILKEIKN